MLKTPVELPERIKKALDSINFLGVSDEAKHPFYFASYAVVKLKGWDIAHENLKKNLTNILEIVKQDDFLRSREEKIRVLSANIENLDLNLDFYTEEFYQAHKSKYLRTVQRLTVGQRPLSYSSFRYIGIGELRKNEPIKKIRRKITIPDEVTQIEYKAYLSDFEIENFNPHLNEYKRLYRKVNPKNLIRYPISEVYQFFEEEITCVYKNTNIRKNSLEKDYRFLRNICSEKSRGLIPRLHFTPFGFIGVPEILTGNEQEIMVLTGGKFGGKLGGGGADFYERSEDRFTLKKSVIYWMS